ncbi:MAG: hypothetical protein LKF53_07625 [Solobacterium sp.]|jgi:hypothetical protein|nr:hypothetical protein [Solobacterium sp.]MCH4206243.1 hypothetical protein [Solobacterium sp.]MCH4227732.1 hypothetical protein [Solobacterium sp.]MCH4283159.1 hypothetical protein [Solobacterium sp.]
MCIAEHCICADSCTGSRFPIGYPIWWGDAAWPINGFVTANDFTNKKVISFCTSASSEVGDSGTDLAEKTNGGNWLEGKRFSTGNTETEIAQ